MATSLIFLLFLPGAQMQVPGVSRTGPEKKDLTGTETVLLVEDERAILALDKAILERQGYTVQAARGHPLAIGLLSSIACGAAPGSPVTHEYKPPSPFTGTIHSVTVDVSGDLIKDAEAEVRMILARQ